ncbi:hypothetical protein B0H19DRAFT_1065085 [Mycena capillaripes]|nr:hypothetical protein B0H19DRAFT_1065085 [Mycena capillaripes]
MLKIVRLTPRLENVPVPCPSIPRIAAFAVLASLLLGVTAQTQPVPTLCDFKCLKGQYIVGGEANWALTGSSYDVAVKFMSDFCGASIGNTAVNCTGGALGSTRRVLQANGVYITEQLQNLTRTPGSLSQVYYNHSTSAVSMSMTTHKCVSNATMGNAAVVALLAEAQTYYISALSNATHNGTTLDEHFQRSVGGCEVFHDTKVSNTRGPDNERFLTFL